MSPWLELKGIHYSYNKAPLFTDLNLTLESSGLYFCTGPSGVGKTTLALLLSGHLIAHKGQILLQGELIQLPSRRSLLVTQEDDLFPWLKTKDQLKFFANFPDTLTEYTTLLKSLRLEDALDLYPHQMSGGMKKRLALLRSIILKPKLLILDETLSSVDQELRFSILHDFSELWKKLSIGVILITHDLHPKTLEIADGKLEISSNNKIRTMGFSK